MSNKPILFVVFFILFFYGSSYASGPTGGTKSVSASSSKMMSKKKSDQVNGNASSSPNRSYNKVTEPKSLPTEIQRRKKVSSDIDQLIISSKKASSDIRKEIKRIKAQKNANINNAEIKNARNFADQLDKYTHLLQKKKRLLQKGGNDVDESLKETLSDMSQMEMLKLQDAMNRKSQLMQMMSNIQKRTHDTSMAIIRNMK